MCYCSHFTDSDPEAQGGCHTNVSCFIFKMVVFSPCGSALPLICGLWNRLARIGNNWQLSSWAPNRIRIIHVGKFKGLLIDRFPQGQEALKFMAQLWWQSYLSDVPPTFSLGRGGYSTLGSSVLQDSFSVSAATNCYKRSGLGQHFYYYIILGMKSPKSVSLG